MTQEVNSSPKVEEHEQKTLELDSCDLLIGTLQAKQVLVNPLCFQLYTVFMFLSYFLIYQTQNYKAKMAS
jgi:hypothetical protein